MSAFTGRKPGGFTLIELLMVIVIIAILATLLLPVLSRGKLRARQVECANNLKQIGVGFHAWAHDHNSKFPMQISTNVGGTFEVMPQTFRHFQVLSNELETTKILICPADTRRAAQSFAAMRDENLSYFINPSADYERGDTWLAGDRNVISATNNTLQWTEIMHQFRGNLLFADGRVEQLGAGGPALMAGGPSRPPPIQPPNPPYPSPNPPYPSPNPTPNPTPNPSPNPSPNPAPGPGSTPGSGTPASFPNYGSSSRPSSPGGGGSHGGASAGAESSGGALDKLEKIFAVNRPSATPASGQSRSTTTKPDKPKPEAELLSETKAEPTNLVAKATPADTNAGPVIGDDLSGSDPSTGDIAKFIGTVGYKTTYPFLLILLALLAAMELFRRRKKKGGDQPSVENV